MSCFFLKSCESLVTLPEATSLFAIPASCRAPSYIPILPRRLPTFAMRPQKFQGAILMHEMLSISLTHPVDMSSNLLVSPCLVGLLVTLLAHVSCSSEALPSISIPRCNTDSPAMLKGLFRSNSSIPFPARTSISLCWTPDNLLLEYDSQDDFTLRNDFLECNSPMYSQVSAHYFILLCAFLLCSGC
jgi:hypothetical protein